MFKIYTKHTQEVGETVIEHLWFTMKIGFFMVSSGVLLFVHGVTGGLLPMPKAMNIDAVRDRMNRVAEAREIKKKAVSRAEKTRKQLQSLYALKQGDEK